MVIKQRGLTLSAARNWLGRDFSFLLGPEPLVLRAHFDQPSLYVVFASRGSTKDGIARKGYCEIDLPDGQILRSTSQALGIFRGERIDVASFEIIPFTQERLHVRLEFGEESIHFDIKNPKFAPNAPRWRAAPLPQTRKIEDLEITLKAVVASRSYARPSESFWVARPEFVIRRRGMAVTAEEWGSWEFQDPLGNASSSSGLFIQPVWKVCVRQLRRSPGYPRMDAEIKWLGRTPLPGPGEIREIPDEALSAERSRVLLGPGRYTFTSGRFVAISEKADTSETDTVVDAASFVLFAFEDDYRRTNRTLLYMRDESGQRVALVSEFGGGRYRFTPDPKARVVELGLVGPDMDVEFLVKAPEPPAELYK